MEDGFALLGGLRDAIGSEQESAARSNERMVAELVRQKEETVRRQGEQEE